MRYACNSNLCHTALLVSQRSRLLHVLPPHPLSSDSERVRPVSMYSLGVKLLEANKLPDTLCRLGIRRLLLRRLREIGALDTDVAAHARRTQEFVDELRANTVIAIHTSDANEQHYEVPTEFFQLCLGPRLKYSCCLFLNNNDTLQQAEDNMLALYCERANVRDGMEVLDLGCGWGSLTLYLAEHFPNCRITSLSNSKTQREHIEKLCGE